jgi:hypothetical protein
MAGSLVARAARHAAWAGLSAETKKSPASKTPGWEALLLSHIKAPAQGGKAGSGKPPKTEFNKGKTTYQANARFFVFWVQKKNTNPFICALILGTNDRAALSAARKEALQAQFST